MSASRLRSSIDSEGRWCFRLPHSCGHEEAHRIRILQPDGSCTLPTTEEREGILWDLRQRPCNACQVGVPAGRSLKIIEVHERATVRE